MLCYVPIIYTCTELLVNYSCLLCAFAQNVYIKVSIIYRNLRKVMGRNMWLKVILAISFSKKCHVLQETERDYKTKGLLSYVFANRTKVKKLYNKPRSQLIAYNQNV